MFKKLWNLIHKPVSKTLEFKNWSEVKYAAAVYEIAPTVDGQWGACVCLFMEKPDYITHPRNNSVLLLQLNIIHPTPEEVATQLHTLGPCFISTSGKAIQINTKGEITKIWTIDRLNKTPEYVTPDNIVRPTHEGSNTVN